MKCPKCHFDNPGDSIYCSKCATRLDAIPQISVTRTLETTTDDLARGVVFAGRYEIIEELGTGGMGKVYRAFDKKIDEEVALKLIKPEIAAERKTVERFHNELRIARKISHPNVCRMHDLNEEGKTLYITMEYVTGEDLKSVIHRMGILTAGKAVSIARQVAEGLGQAHKLGVVHRDLKPHNIMIDKGGNAKIMDFGIARSLEAKGVTGEGVIVGTPEYMSPEQVEGKPADARSDIYALGVILFEMVTGHTPFEGETPMSIAHKHKYEPVPDPQKLNPQIPGGLKRIILRSLEKSREKRYQTTEEFLADLAAAEEGLPTAERSTTAKRKPLSSREITVKLTPKKLLIPAGVLIGVAAIVFGILKFLPKKEAPPPSTGPPVVAVLPFQNLSGSKDFDVWEISLSISLITKLTQSRYINVLPYNQIYGILKRLNLLEVENYTPEELNKIASQGQATHIVQGSLSKAGERFRIDLNLQNASTQRIIAPENVDGTGEDSIFTMVDKLAASLKMDLGLTPQQEATDIDKDISKVFTTSTEAFKFYAQGLQFDISGDFNQAISYFERAVAVDPQFAMAYLCVALDYFGTGKMKECRVNIRKAFDLREKLPERERYLIEAEYYSYASEKTWDKAVDAYTKLIRIYPWDLLANMDLAFLYARMNECDKVIDLIETFRRYTPEPETSGFAGFYQTLTWSYLCKGQPEKARELLEGVINRINDNGFFRANLAIVYCIEGDFERAKKEIDKAYTQIPDLDKLYKLVYLLCREDFAALETLFKEMEAAPNAMIYIGVPSVSSAFQGKLKEAKTKYNRELEKWRGAADPSTLAFASLRFASFLEKSSDLSRALAVIESGLRFGREVGDGDSECKALYYRGVIQVRQGNLEEARHSAEELRLAIGSYPVKKRIRYYEGLLGLIALKQNDPARAQDYLQRAVSLTGIDVGFMWFDNRPEFLENLAEACEQAGRWEEARKAYEGIMSIKSIFLYGAADTLILARSYYKLGKVLERLGDRAGAAARYRKFLDLWKNADPGLPEVEDAKKRLVGLQSH
jgi:serine/threonine protein kinase/Tfp pilus assembly protein PilF